MSMSMMASPRDWNKAFLAFIDYLNTILQLLFEEIENIFQNLLLQLQVNASVQGLKTGGTALEPLHLRMWMLVILGSGTFSTFLV